MKDPYSTRDARLMTADDLRKLVRSIDNQNEGINSSLDAQGMLDLEWACWDGGTWNGFDAWCMYEPEEANEAFDNVLEDVEARSKGY